MNDGKVTKVAYADPHYANSILKSLDRIGPKLTRKESGRTAKEKKEIKGRLSQVN